MALEPKDIEALQLLIREENRVSEERLNHRFDEVMATLDTLVGHDEKREQENAIRDNQMKRFDERTESLENRVDSLEKKVA